MKTKQKKRHRRRRETGESTPPCTAMTFFLPSEVHRLVLGFLQNEAKCPGAVDKFLTESSSLAEVAALRRRRNGAALFKSSLKVAGKSLVDVLEEYQQ